LESVHAQHYVRQISSVKSSGGGMYFTLSLRERGLITLANMVLKTK